MLFSESKRQELTAIKIVVELEIGVRKTRPYARPIPKIASVLEMLPLKSRRAQGIAVPQLLKFLFS